MSLREQKKRQTRAAILTEANRRFTENGFEATTLEEICDAAKISKRTFFRYFAGKEDLVFPNHEQRLEAFLGFLAAAPEDETCFDTLRRATTAFAMDYTANRDRFISQYNLIRESPALLAREHQIDREWERQMAMWFAERIEGEVPNPQLYARVMAGAAIGVIRATMRHWYGTDGTEDLERLGHDALDNLERGFFS